MKKKKFEVDKTGIQFTCTHGVYRNNGSMCYCTDIHRANLIAWALNKLTLKQVLAFIKRDVKNK